MKKVYLAIDPGREKCGLAVVDSEGVPQLLKAIVIAEFATTVIELLQEYSFTEILVGSGTGRKEFVAIFRENFPAKKIIIVNEKNTTILGKTLYWQYNQPKGWRKLIPVSLRIIPEPVDAYAALAIALRWLQSEK